MHQCLFLHLPIEGHVFVASGLGHLGRKLLWASVCKASFHVIQITVWSDCGIRRSACSRLCMKLPSCQSDGAVLHPRQQGARAFDVLFPRQPARDAVSDLSFSRSHRCAVESYCCFDERFPKVMWYWGSFVYCCHPPVFFGEVCELASKLTPEQHWVFLSTIMEDLSFV